MLQHGETEVIEVIESVLIWQESIPNGHGVKNVEVLAAQEHEPSERVKLGIDIVQLEMSVELQIIFLNDQGKGLDSSFDACILLVQEPAESISDLSHEICEAEE